MRVVFAAIALLLLTACATTPNPILAKRNATYRPYCEREGLLSGTFGFADCVMWQEMVDLEQQKARAGR